MTAATVSPSPHSRGTLEDFLPSDEIVAVPELSDDEWNRIRRHAGPRLAWRFCTLRNLLVHRGRFARDAVGFAWGGIYRTLLVGSIVTTSFRNEGHFRAGERMTGTGDFFFGSFVLPRSAEAFRELVGMVNLRHHVAGVVQLRGADGVAVLPGYEADYAYVATAFIEAIRRGLEACGLPLDGRVGRELGEHVFTVLYQLAGCTGLARMPRDLAAHDRFRAAYDRRLREHPPSGRVRRMAQEIARRIMPFTAAQSDTTVREHIRRHLDPETAEFLFPAGDVPGELEAVREEWCRRRVAEETLADIERRSRTRRAIWMRPDVAALHAAYRAAAPAATDDRLIGAILLHAIDTREEPDRPLERRTIDLAAGEPLIHQGKTPGEMYVVLSATAPLVVLHAADAAAEPRQVATLTAPIVLGEIGMWRGQPAVATVLSRIPNRLDVLVIDRRRFEALKEESGFRSATAAEVQRRLSLNATLVGTLLDDVATATGDPRLASIAQLFRYLSGDSHVPLDAVIGLPDDATPAECVEALREQVDGAIAAGGLPPELERHLERIIVTIG